MLGRLIMSACERRAVALTRAALGSVAGRCGRAQRDEISATERMERILHFRFVIRTYNKLAVTRWKRATKRPLWPYAGDAPGSLCLSLSPHSRGAGGKIP